MVSLETLKVSTDTGTHVHMTEEDFEITSSVPVTEIGTCQVLSKAYPGRIGRYILPKDSVITLGRGETTTADVRKLLDMERSSIAHAHSNRMNHVTVQTQEDTHEDEYESEEEDEFDDDGEDEQEEDSAEVVSDDEEDGDMQCEWEDDSCQNEGTKKKDQKDGENRSHKI